MSAQVKKEKPERAAHDETWCQICNTYNSAKKSNLLRHLSSTGLCVTPEDEKERQKMLEKRQKQFERVQRSQKSRKRGPKQNADSEKMAKYNTDQQTSITGDHNTSTNTHTLTTTNSHNDNSITNNNQVVNNNVTNNFNIQFNIPANLDEWSQMIGTTWLNIKTGDKIITFKDPFFHFLCRDSILNGYINRAFQCENPPLVPVNVRHEKGGTETKFLVKQDNGGIIAKSVEETAQDIGPAAYNGLYCKTDECIDYDDKMVQIQHLKHIANAGVVCGRYHKQDKRQLLDKISALMDRTTSVLLRWCDDDKKRRVTKDDKSDRRYLKRQLDGRSEKEQKKVRAEMENLRQSIVKRCGQKENFPHINEKDIDKFNKAHLDAVDAENKFWADLSPCTVVLAADSDQE